MHHPGWSKSRVLQLSKKKDKSKLVLLCVGRIHPRKGQLELIEAVSKLPEDIISNLNLIFVGPVVSKPYFSKKKKESQNFKGAIEFKGDLLVEDLRGCYQNADIFCLCPTVQKKSVEGFGLVYLEASSFGLPILATRTGGIEDAVIDGQTGLIADHKTPDELCEKLLELVMNENLRKKLEKMVKFGLSNTHGRILHINFIWKIKVHPQKRDEVG